MWWEERVIKSVPQFSLYLWVHRSCICTLYNVHFWFFWANFGHFCGVQNWPNNRSKNSFNAFLLILERNASNILFGPKNSNFVPRWNNKLLIQRNSPNFKEKYVEYFLWTKKAQILHPAEITRIGLFWLTKNQKWTYLYSSVVTNIVWVSKLDVKLGGGGMLFKIIIFQLIYKNHDKSKMFQTYGQQQA